MEVLRLSQGDVNKEIPGELRVAEKTVNTRQQHPQKLHLADRTQAALYAGASASSTSISQAEPAGEGAATACTALES
jgi:DNA-binding NarL/FixJ family response regulator